MLNPFTSMLPWLIGALATAVMCITRRRNLATSLVCAGTGGFVGHISIAFLISACVLLGKSPFVTELVLSLYVAFTVLMLFAIYSLGKLLRSVTFEPSHFPSGSTLFSLLPLFAIASTGVMLSAFSPADGWDALSGWLPKAVKILDYSATSDPTAFLNIDRWGNLDRHPMNISSMLAWEAYSRGNYVFYSSSNIAAVCTALLVLAGMARAFNCNVLAFTATSYFFLTTPLIGNHISIYGYAEIFIAVSLLCAVSLISIGLYNSDRAMLVGGCLLSSLCVGMKNTGFIYALFPVSSLIIVAWTTIKIGKPRRHIIALTSAILFCSLISLSLYFDLQNFVKFDYDKSTLWVAGKQINFLWPSLADFFWIEISSKVNNVSFSLCLSIIIVSIFLTRSFRHTPHLYPAFFHCLLTQIIGLTVLFLSLFTYHGYEHALPKHDTGHSRFSVPIFALTPLLILFLWSFVEQRWPRDSED